MIKIIVKGIQNYIINVKIADIPRNWIYWLFLCYCYASKIYLSIRYLSIRYLSIYKIFIYL